jgi:hypothetical protein
MPEEFVKYNRYGDIFTIHAGIEPTSNQMVVSTKRDHVPESPPLCPCPLQVARTKGVLCNFGDGRMLFGCSTVFLSTT